jgi:ABC-type polysaccharide/polyol phosphate transport system ATPase subunit
MPETVTRVSISALRKEFPAVAAQMTAFRLLSNLRVAQTRSTGNRNVIDIPSFTAQSGEVLGIIGDNGAGKTTLLKLIAGLYAPSAGEITTHGVVAFFAGLGVGMIQDLTVRENVRLYGAIHGLTRAQLKPLFGEILAWAELDELADFPLRNLSAGMRTRLAFAIAGKVQADVLLVDEAFSAGDRRFQAHCDEIILSRRGGPTAVIIATHNTAFVSRLCTRAVWLDHGSIREAGDPADVVDKYLAYAAPPHNKAIEAAWRES